MNRSVPFSLSLGGRMRHVAAVVADVSGRFLFIRETQVAYAVPSSFPYSWLNSGNAFLNRAKWRHDATRGFVELDNGRARRARETAAVMAPLTGQAARPLPGMFETAESSISPHQSAIR